jgi:D-serine deaminase-like pyridoxal phosphate-dependent protein
MATDRREEVRASEPARTPAEDYQRFRAALGSEPLPAAIVDLDALNANIDALVAAAHPKPLRIATKSIRCPALVHHIFERAKGKARGLMTYTAEETAYLAEQDHDDELLLAYPTVHPHDATLLARANRAACARVVVDEIEHLAPLEAAAAAEGTRIPVVVDVDVAYSPIDAVYLGVRRSPLRTPEQVVNLVRCIGDHPHLSFAGLMAYEAQIAGVPDTAATSAMKALSRRDVARRRADVVRVLEGAGLYGDHPLFNGGGTGSLATSASENVLTELTCGSGFLASHLFDGYRGLSLVPAAFFALQVVRVPAPGIVTCHGGGFVASGAAGKDRLPLPVLPAGLGLLPLEGAGEVQTPLSVPEEVTLRVGDPVFFRHAKAGELAEHVREYILVEKDRVVGRVPTYRGLGVCFLG